MLDRLGHGCAARRRHRRPCRAARPSGWRWPGRWCVKRRVRPAGARRADEPPRHRRDRLARGPAGRVPGRAGPRHPRPPPARPGHDPDPGARPGHRLRPRGWLRLVPRGPGPARGAGRRGRGDPPQPGPQGAGLAAPRCSGPHPQAQGPHRDGHRHRRGPGRGCRPRRHPRSAPRHPPTGRPGGRAPRRRALATSRTARPFSSTSSCCSTTGSGWGSSAPTAPASRRCSRSSPGGSRRGPVGW